MDKQTFIQKAKLLQPGYVPNPAVKALLAQVSLLAVVGPSGSGKSSIIEHSGLAYVTSDTTRLPRATETNGIDYDFRTDYNQMVHEIERGEYVQFIVYPTGEFYGTRAASFPASGPCTMAITAAAIPLFLSLGFRRVLPVYIVPPSYDVWLERARSRPEVTVQARLGEAQTSLQLALSDAHYYFMLNDDLLVAAQLFRDVTHGEPLDPAKHAAAHQVAAGLLAKIQAAAPPTAPAN